VLYFTCNHGLSNFHQIVFTELGPNSTTRTPATDMLYTTAPTDTTNGQAHNNSTTNLPHRNARAQHLDMSRCWDVAFFSVGGVELLWARPLVVSVGAVRSRCSEPVSVYCVKFGTYCLSRNVVSYTGVIDDKRAVRQLIDSVTELDWRVVLEPTDLRWRITCHYRAAEYHPAGLAHRLSLVFTEKKHLRRHYNARQQFSDNETSKIRNII